MPSRTQFSAVQEHFGLAQAAAVEKDWHVVLALQAVIAVDASPFHLVFAGGTALERTHKQAGRGGWFMRYDSQITQLLGYNAGMCASRPGDRRLDSK